MIPFCAFMTSPLSFFLHYTYIRHTSSFFNVYNYQSSIVAQCILYACTCAPVCNLVVSVSSL